MIFLNPKKLLILKKQTRLLNYLKLIGKLYLLNLNILQKMIWILILKKHQPVFMKVNSNYMLIWIPLLKKKVLVLVMMILYVVKSKLNKKQLKISRCQNHGMKPKENSQQSNISKLYKQHKKLKHSNLALKKLILPNLPQ